RQGDRRHLRLHRRQRRDQTVDLERRRQPEVAVPGRRRRLPPADQPAQRQVPRRRRRLHGRRGEHHPVHLRRRHEPAMAVAGHREPLPPRRPAQRQMPRRRRLRHRRRGRHPAVHLRLRHQPAVVPYSVLGAHTMRRPALTTAARLLAVCTLAMALIAAPAHASNPLVHRFAADPSMHVYDNRVYVYTTDDESNSGTYWDSDAWRVHSSSDLVIWTAHGAPFSVGGFAWATRYAWAPSAAQRNGYYYLSLPTGRSRVGVARSTSPTGGFTDPRGTPLIEKGRDANTGEEPIDPAVFIDDNGQAYLYFGGARAPKVVRLNADMISTTGAIQNVTINGGSGFAEAGFMHKRNGVYYYSYSTGWPGQIAYATSTSPLGPFTYRGVILESVNVNTNHHSIAAYNGQWYIAYHRNARAGGGTYKRSLAMEYLSYEAAGTIRRVTQTSTGVGTPTIAADRLQSHNFPD